MKIPRLFTSQRFGFWLKSITTKEFCRLSGAPEPIVIEGANGFFRIDAIKLRLRDDWDKKLTGSLKKEMFVNELEDPTSDKFTRSVNCPLLISEEYQQLIKTWQIAEKKVIFKDNQFEGMSNHEFAYPKTRLPFRDTAMQDFETLGELAEYYEGELETINITI